MTTYERTAPVTYTEKITAEYGVECFIEPVNNLAILYVGKANKPAFHIRFRSSERLHEYVNEYIQRYTTNKRNDELKRNAASAANKDLKASDHFQLGDIVVNTWGYDQTNVDFYQVIEVLNKKIRVRAICSKTVESTGPMSSNVMPVKDDFYGEKILLLSIKFKSWALNEVSICNPESYYYFQKWDGRAKYCSWYA